MMDFNTYLIPMNHVLDDLHTFAFLLSFILFRFFKHEIKMFERNLKKFSMSLSQTQNEF